MNRFDESNKVTKFKRTLFGLKDNIFSFAIATSENPMAEEKTEEENIELRKNLEQKLRAFKLSYYKVLGKYINYENSYLIPNIPLILCKDLFGRKQFNQESFIYGEVDENNKIHYFYYEQDNNGEFQLADEYDEKNAEKRNKGDIYKSLSQEGAEDFYSKYIDYKFSIPFSVFERYLRDYSKKLDERLSYNPNYRKELKKLVLDENRPISSVWRKMNMLLLTEEQDTDRRKRVAEVLNKEKKINPRLKRRLFTK